VFVRSVLGSQLAAPVVGLLDQVLLVFMIVEILYKRALHGEMECMRGLAVLILLVGVATAAPAWGADARHSGRVLAVDPGAGRLRLEELTAAPGPEPRSVELKLQVTPDTAIHRVARAAVDPAGWPNAWREERTTIHTVKPGDFVTATTGERGDVALTLEVVEPDH
jgi:hypothetical protein